MKKFIYQLLFFAFQFALVPLLLFVSFTHASKRQAEAWTLPPSINKVVIGDSRIQMAVNESLLYGTKNLSLGSESFFYSFYKFQHLLKKNKQIYTLLLGVSYHSFSAYYYDFTYHPDVAQRYFFILPLRAQLRLLMNVENPFKLLMKSFTISYKNLRGQNNFSFLGGFSTHATDLPLSCESIENRIYAQFYSKKKLREISSLNAEYFSKIKILCAKKKVKLIALNSPMHPEYAQGVPKKFRDTYDSLVARQGITVIDFNELVLNDKDFLPDGDHLTIGGANKATLYLKNKLSRNIEK